MCQNGRCICLENYVIRFDVCVLPDGITSSKFQGAHLQQQIFYDFHY